MELSPGTKISHYTINEVIGRGGHGIVYRAVDNRLERQVALKTLERPSHAAPEMMERLRREAKRLASFQHPNIVTVYDIEEVGGTVLLAMELVHGGTLRKEMHRGRPTMSRWLEVTEALSQALAAAHKERVIHRDLKPDNILIDADGRPKLADFGLALLRPPSGIDSHSPTQEVPLTKTGVIVGTPVYMSPEQLRGGDASRQSDIFSLCVVLCEFLTGRHPFASGGQGPTVDAICSQAPASIGGTKEWRVVPREIRKILSCGLSKAANDRPSSATEIGDIARRWRQSGRATRPVRHIATLITYPLAAFLVGAGIYLAMTMWRTDRSRQPGNEGHEGLETPTAIGDGVASVAVLPCDSQITDPTVAFLAKGFPDSVISGLTRQSSLRVVPAENMAGMAGSVTSAEDVARRLNVHLVVTCNMRVLEEQVEVSARIYDSRKNAIVWADVIGSDRSAGQLADLRGQLATAIIQQAGVSSTASHGADNGFPRDVATGVFLDYMRGRDLYQRYERSDNLRAIDIFEEIVRRAPGYVDGHVALAQAYYQMTSKVWDTNPLWLERAREEARRAVELDPGSADAFAALGFVLVSQGYSESALKQFERALEISPQHADAGIYLAGTLLRLGRKPEAREQIEKQLKLYPDYFKTHLVMAAIEWGDGEYEKAAKFYERVVFLLPGFLRGYSNLARALHLAGADERAFEILGRAEKLLESVLSEYMEMAAAYSFLKRPEDEKRILELGIARARKAIQEAGSEFDGYRYLARLSAQLGDATTARQALNSMLDRFSELELTWIYAAQVQAVLDDRDEALASLRRARAINPRFMNWAGAGQEFRPYIKDDEFRAVFATDDAEK